MKTHLNTLFVTLEGAYLRKDGAAVEIRHEGETKLRVPLHNLDGIAAFGWDITASAAESTGLDPQCGFLHRDRPGRPSLALDLMEELRPALADRAALTLINRQQIRASDFEVKENGAVLLKDDSRKTVLQHWQERKLTEIVHPFLQEKIALGLLPHLQARLFARHLRADLDAYPAFLLK